MSGVDVEDLPVRLELGVEERDELRRQAALVEDPVQPLERPGDLQVAPDRHPEADVDVADEKGGEEAVPGGVGDRGAEAVVPDRDEVVEVAAHQLGRTRDRRDVEVADGRDGAREDRLLDPVRLLDQPLQLLGPELAVDGRPDDAEGEEKVGRRDARRDVEGEQIPLVSHRDRREALHAEARLELAVDGRVGEVGQVDPVREGAPDGRVVGGDGQARLDLPRAAEALRQDVLVVAPDVEASAEDAELVPEVPDDRPRRRRGSWSRRRANARWRRASARRSEGESDSSCGAEPAGRVRFTSP